MTRAGSLAGAPILHLAEVDSTNAEARRRVDTGEAGPLWIVTGRQTAGRGRRGRSWETAGGNLAATLLFALEKSPAEAALISFVAALAVGDLVQAYTPPGAVKLKWPNDVLLAGSKVAGILIESGRLVDGRLWLAAGMGVNLNTPPEVSERPATAIADHLHPAVPVPPTVEEAAPILAAAFARWLSVWEGQGSAALLAAWRARAGGFGQPCAARLDAETIEGVAEGIEDDGALRLRLPDGAIRRITAGDVFFPGLMGAA